MGEIRKHYLLDKFVIIAPERAKRPDSFKSEHGERDPSKSPFTKDKRSELPDVLQTWDLEQEPEGIVLTHNKFPIVKQDGDPNIETHNTFYTFSANYGEHVVLIEGGTPCISFASFSVEDMSRVLFAYQDTIKRLRANGMQYVCLFKNEGPAAGASIDHPHSQAISLAVIPHEVMLYYQAALKHKTTHGSNGFMEFIAAERESVRHVASHDGWTAFCPYASENPMEIVLFPDRKISTFENLSEQEVRGLANHLKHVLGKLDELNAPYNLEVINGDDSIDFQCHVIITPRFTKRAGFEYISGIIVNPLPPENAAKFYRGENHEQ